MAATKASEAASTSVLAVNKLSDVVIKLLERVEKQEDMSSKRIDEQQRHIESLIDLHLRETQRRENATAAPSHTPAPLPVVPSLPSLNPEELPPSPLRLLLD